MHGKVPTAAPAGKHKHNCMILAKQAHRRNSRSGEIADHLIYPKNPGRQGDVREFLATRVFAIELTVVFEHADSRS